MNDQENNQLNNAQISINAQYIKDLSFENNSAPMSLVNAKGQPKVNLSLDVGSVKMQSDTYEVIIEIKADVATEDTTLFVVELEYAALFTLTNVPQEHIEGILYVHCPSIIFPFARRIVADVTRDGGFQPLMIDPIDFLSFYNSRKDQITKAE